MFSEATWQSEKVLLHGANECEGHRRSHDITVVE
jgi:hypothetical protein